jgi:hypothetical protein
MTCEPGPSAAQGACALNGCVAMEDNALAESNHHGIAMHTHAVARLDFNVAIKFDMRMEMFGRLFDFDAARCVELFGREQASHAAGDSSMSANILL